ncbi:RecA-like protein [Sinorhizobium phage phiN3]|uniref:RecA-like protein n=1 Tax=Sinorhizobium phage phiN3 TaxID=1647405 RepID=A0A0F6SIZ2_9CAUD|nr:DNA repair protein [Sinorhizobium phage phiN3]AKF13298.1 RecA-like protein [Sinorhizobium phage phiN3]
MSLLDKMMKAGVEKSAGILSKSKIFNEKFLASTNLASLNIALSGDIDGGLTSGVTLVAGESKSFKTLLMLYMLKAYFEKFADAVCLFYDNEFGATPEYLKAFGIDPERIIHIPTTNIEGMTFDVVSRLEKVERGDHVVIMIDSLGNIASKKEVEDAQEGKGTVDMTRAKMLKKFFRLVTPHLTIKDIPLIAIQHVYKEQGAMYPKNIVSGGSGGIYSSNIILIITKSQEKDGTELIGWNFTINVEKSRFVQEKAKLPFTVLYEGGVSRYSGLMDIALEGNFVVKPSNGWYSKVDPDTGEIEDKKYRMKETGNKEFWGSIINHPKFKEYVKSQFQLGELDVDHESAQTEESEETDA